MSVNGIINLREQEMSIAINESVRAAVKNPLLSFTIIEKENGIVSTIVAPANVARINLIDANEIQTICFYKWDVLSLYELMEQLFIDNYDKCDLNIRERFRELLNDYSEELESNYCQRLLIFDSGDLLLESLDAMPTIKNAVYRITDYVCNHKLFDTSMIAIMTK